LKPRVRTWEVVQVGGRGSISLVDTEREPCQGSALEAREKEKELSVAVTPATASRAGSERDMATAPVHESKKMLAPPRVRESLPSASPMLGTVPLKLAQREVSSPRDSCSPGMDSVGRDSAPDRPTLYFPGAGTDTESSPPLSHSRPPMLGGRAPARDRPKRSASFAAPPIRLPPDELEDEALGVDSKKFMEGGDMPPKFAPGKGHEKAQLHLPPEEGLKRLILPMLPRGRVSLRDPRDRLRDEMLPNAFPAVSKVTLPAREKGKAMPVPPMSPSPSFTSIPSVRLQAPALLRATTAYRGIPPTLASPLPVMA